MVRSRLALLGLALALLAVLPATAFAADSNAERSRVVIGFELHFTGPDSTAGTFVASGAVQDAGTSTVRDIVLVPFGRQDKARLSGEQTFAGAKGSIVTQFRGIAEDVSKPQQFGRGRFTIVSGTGAYADLEGRGRFTIVVDVVGNHLIGTELGHVH